MDATSLTINDLPSEILLQILSPLPTAQLLPLARVNYRFYDVTLRIIHTRLTDAAWLPDHELILECYHPSAKISTPYLHCDYLRTDGLEGYRDVDDDDASSQPGFAQLRNFYSRFRPVVQEDQRGTRSRSFGQQATATAAVDDDADDDRTATVSINLDEGEMFSQLCAVTNLVKTGPRRGLFLSHVNVNDGVVRVFRRWLAARAAGGDSSEDDSEDPILWTDRHRNVGIKFRVTEDVGARPTLWARADEDEDLPVSYTLVYEELLVRTSTLLLEVEKSEAQEVTNTDLGFVKDPGSKVPCLGQQMFFWFQTPHMSQRQQHWAPAPFISVGGA